MVAPYFHDLERQVKVGHALPSEFVEKFTPDWSGSLLMLTVLVVSERRRIDHAVSREDINQSVTRRSLAREPLQKINNDTRKCHSVDFGLRNDGITQHSSANSEGVAERIRVS